MVGIPKLKYVKALVMFFTNFQSEIGVDMYKKIVPCLVMFATLLVSGGQATEFENDNAVFYYKKASLIFKQAEKTLFENEKIDKSIDNFCVFCPQDKIKNTRELFDLFFKGNMQKRCDWKTDFSSNGSLTTLYDFSDAINLNHFICSCIIEKFLEGERKKAIQLLIGNMILSRHLAEEKCLIASNVACSLQERCIKIGYKMLDKLDANELKMLYDGLNSITPMPSVADKILAERDILIMWIKKNPIQFFQYIESVKKPIAIGNMRAYGENKRVTYKELVTVSFKIMQVDYVMIDKY
jgi:hypothetical protein